MIQFQPLTPGRDAKGPSHSWCHPLPPRIPPQACSRMGALSPVFLPSASCTLPSPTAIQNGFSCNEAAGFHIGHIGGTVTIQGSALGHRDGCAELGVMDGSLDGSGATVEN